MTISSEEIPFGDVAQLGEHLLCKQGVTGSIPVTSTKFFIDIFGEASDGPGGRVTGHVHQIFLCLRNARRGQEDLPLQDREIEYVRGAEFQFAQQVGPQHDVAAGFCARTKALMNLSRI